jgi:hypothetical protein
LSLTTCLNINSILTNSTCKHKCHKKMWWYHFDHQCYYRIISPTNSPYNVDINDTNYQTIWNLSSKEIWITFSITEVFLCFSLNTRRIEIWFFGVTLNYWEQGICTWTNGHLTSTWKMMFLQLFQFGSACHIFPFIVRTMIPFKV